ncbi:hypothetical protein SK128_014025, partial [Halocaridina rubra]
MPMTKTWSDLIRVPPLFGSFKPSFSSFDSERHKRGYPDTIPRKITSHIGEESPQ